MQFSTGPAAERREPAMFRRQDARTPIGWFGVPGPSGFEVGQHLSIERLDTADNGATVTRWTWVVFTLRSSDAARALRDVLSLLPGRWNCERCGDELVLFVQGRRRLSSRALWEFAYGMQELLERQLTHPMRTSSSAERARRGIRLAIES